MSLDPEHLHPSRPLPVGDRRYVPRTWGGGDRLAALLRSRLSPIAVAGASGSGKTTELHRALERLDAEPAPGGERIVPFYFAIEEVVGDTRDLSRPVVLHGIAQSLLVQVVSADLHHFAPSQALVEDLRSSDPRFSKGHGRKVPPKELASLAIFEAMRVMEAPRLAVLVDGLDRLKPEAAREVALALLEIADLIDLAVVVPPELTYGPESPAIVSRFRIFTVYNAPVDDDAGLPWQEGRQFLAGLAARRFGIDGLDAGMAAVADRAAALSGGNPRKFLELIRDSFAHAEVGGRGDPDVPALEEAAREHADTMRRLLMAGDRRALAEADRTDGLEVPEDRRVRFLAHSLLLEYPRGDDVVVRVHPLARRLLAS